MFVSEGWGIILDARHDAVKLMAAPRPRPTVRRICTLQISACLTIWHKLVKIANLQQRAATGVLPGAAAAVRECGDAGAFTALLPDPEGAVRPGPEAGDPGAVQGGAQTTVSDRAQAAVQECTQTAVQVTIHCVAGAFYLQVMCGSK